MAEEGKPVVYPATQMAEVMDTVAPPTVLTIAGSDPSGGAGIQADLATIAAFGCHGAAAITALTVQDTRNVHGFRVTPDDELRQQVATVLTDIPVAAVKVGMLGSADNARAVADLLAEYPEIPAVVDPVLVAQGGGDLAQADLAKVLQGTLFPRATVLTPNEHEAHALTGGETVPEAVADELLREGAHYVLLKGGHRHPEEEVVSDRLFSFGQEEASFSHPRLPDRGYHGSGCTLSTAIACALADGREVVESVRTGIDFTFRALRAAYTPGHGQAVPNRLFHWHSWEQED
ncbi:hydroxymethylpyrimidine/phosphomethylpyrimidine kinase [Thiohalorhabdus denitrificans]|uniref:hydroxymethylpyrimidine kinase n=2 Tax=Thiohalorhabdus denitrificans TaxID=381306 RepID=A0A1G5BPN8_9GAMM|nr:hydroxymethylpyrimidine/phosphomethylpyrimidine kinase [Thiohalorhabdus denitrificans]